MMTTIACCLECLKVLALVSSPIIPNAAQKVWDMLGMEGRLSQQSWQEVLDTPLSEGQLLPSPVPLFTKIEDEQIEQEIEKLNKEKTMNDIAVVPELKTEITFEDFAKLDLRVAQIVEAEPVAKSKKLIKLKVDIGLEERTIVAGIKEHCKAEELIGKKIIVVANLKPAKLMGIESQGMLLAAKLDDALEVAHIQHLPPGSTVS